MSNRLDSFEAVVRRAFRSTDASAVAGGLDHPFDARNVHADLPSDVRRLFDNGHYAQATFEALKFIDEEVQRISGELDYGKSLMMRVFGGKKPALSLNAGATRSEISEQEGFKYLFAGAIQGIRNPRGHSSGVVDDPDVCLDHLVLASLLLRRLDDAGLR